MFISTSVVIIALLIVYFSVQLFSLPAKWCVPNADYDCLLKMEQKCFPGDHTGFLLVASWCEGTSCWGRWAYHCDLSPTPTGYVYCEDVGGFGCEDN